jgi:hypothetical protein
MVGMDWMIYQIEKEANGWLLRQGDSSKKWIKTFVFQETIQICLIKAEFGFIITPDSE